MILAIVKQQLRQIRNISRFRFAIAGLLSIITKYKNNLKSRAHKECMAKIGRYVERALDRLTVTTMLLWITVHNTPGLWITRVLRPQGRFSLQWCSLKLFNRRYE